MPLGPFVYPPYMNQQMYHMPGSYQPAQYGYQQYLFDLAVVRTEFSLFFFHSAYVPHGYGH